MKAILILIAIGGLSACSHLEESTRQSGPDYAATTGHKKQILDDPEKDLGKPEIEQRAKYYENEGHSPEEALAQAQIEYLKSAP